MIAARAIVCSILCAAALAAADTRIVDAVKKHDRAGVRALIAQHADVNSTLPDGTTALELAVNQNDLETVTALVRAGANVKAVNRYGVNAISLACTNGNAAMVDLLLKAGEDANSILPGGETALMTAARTGDVVTVKTLIAHGAQVDAKEPKRGQTPIMWAAAEGNTAAVEALIAAGADFKARVDAGFDAFLFAVREGKRDTVEALLKAGVDVNDSIQPARRSSKAKAGTTALILATLNAHYELAAYLLDKGADPNKGLEPTGPGYTSLHIITTVRKSGGGDNDPSPDGSGTMTSLQLVKKLVEKGADINARMTKKVNIGLTSLNTVGATPFVMAARSADAELMRFFAKLGADPNIPTAEGSNAMIVAAGLGTRSPGEDAGTESEVVEALQVCVDLGVDINAVDKNGETPMHGAAYKNLPGAVLFLASHGAKIEVWNQKNKHGWTPLIIAEGYRFGNFKPSFVTIDAFHQVMEAAGVTPAEDPEFPSRKR